MTPPQDEVDPEVEFKSYKTDPSHRLRKAAFYNDEKAIRGLIAKHKHKNKSSRWINKADRFGWSALHYAAFQGHMNICKQLIEAGADANLRTERAGETPLFLAASSNEYQIVKYLIHEVKVDHNISDITGLIPLEVSYGYSHKILADERLQEGKLLRLIPTVRKLLASKFTQLLLQLVLCVFLELFQEKLLVCIGANSVCVY